MVVYTSLPCALNPSLVGCVTSLFQSSCVFTILLILDYYSVARMYISAFYYFCYGSLSELQVSGRTLTFYLEWMPVLIFLISHFQENSHLAPAQPTLPRKDTVQGVCVWVFQHLFTGLTHLFWLDVFNVSYSSLPTLVKKIHPNSLSWDSFVWE